MTASRPLLRAVPGWQEPDSRPDDLLTQWGHLMQATGYTPSTVKTRTATIKALQNFAGVDHVLDLSRQHVIGFLSRPIAPWSKLTYWKGIRQWSEFLVEFGHDPDSALVKGIPKPKTPDPAARPIGDVTIQRLLMADLSKRGAAYVRLALYQALRVHEIAKLRGEDFDLQKGWLTVLGKGAVRKSIPIHPQILELADTMPDRGWWFPSSRGDGHVRAEGVSATIKSALMMVGSRATAHQLRDTAATQFQRQFKDIRLTQTFLRHRSVVSTQKYTGVADEAMQAAVAGTVWEGEPVRPAEPQALEVLAIPNIERLSVGEQQQLLQLLQILGQGAKL